MERGRFLLIGGSAAILASLAGCEPTATAPLDPSDGLAVRLRDSARAGEMTWVDVSRPPDDTGSITISSSDPLTLAVDSDGRAFPLRAGPVTLTARSAALAGSVAIQVAAAADSFQVKFRFRWEPTAAEQAILARAAMRWRRVLRQAAPVSLDLPANACLPGTAPEGVVQQGVVIFVDRFDEGSVAPGVTGTAGPCLVDAAGRSVLGTMAILRSFSTEAGSLAPLAARTWENQFVHQIGQALGLAGHSVDGIPRVELDRSAPGRPRWTGPNALAAYRALGGAEGGVPITPDFTSWQVDLGTGGDVMLAAITAERRISPVTVGALVDRGYRAEPARAEPPPPPAAAVMTLTTAAQPGPAWILDQRGTVRPLPRR